MTIARSPRAVRLEKLERQFRDLRGHVLWLMLVHILTHILTLCVLGWVLLKLR